MQTFLHNSALGHPVLPSKNTFVACRSANLVNILFRAIYESKETKVASKNKSSGCQWEWKTRELLAFSIDRGELARTAVHGADLQKSAVFRSTSKRLSEEAGGS